MNAAPEIVDLLVESAVDVELTAPTLNRSMLSCEQERLVSNAGYSSDPTADGYGCGLSLGA
jgi:hypothetical protein